MQTGLSAGVGREERERTASAILFLHSLLFRSTLSPSPSPSLPTCIYCPPPLILSYPGQQQQQQLRVDVCVIRAAICIAAAAAAGLRWKKKKRKLVPSSSFVLSSRVHLYQLLLEASSSSH